jgi:hypothetical protein
MVENPEIRKNMKYSGSPSTQVQTALLTVNRISSSADGGGMSCPAMETGEVSPVASTNSLIATRSRSQILEHKDTSLTDTTHTIGPIL